jgi:hypothetical protein
VGMSSRCVRRESSEGFVGDGAELRKRRSKFSEILKRNKTKGLAKTHIKKMWVLFFAQLQLKSGQKSKIKKFQVSNERKASPTFKRMKSISNF